MIRAKFMLFTLAVVTVLGSAFIVDAKAYTLHFIYTGAISQTGGATACDDRVNGAAITGGTPNVRASTTVKTCGCDPVFTVATLNTP